MRSLVPCALLLSACAQTIGAVDPHPNILLQPSSAALFLVLAPEVPESILVPSPVPMIEDLDVQRWHETLTRGFHAGFDPYFGKGPAWSLVLLGTQLEYFPTNRAACVTLRYRAQLVDDDGVVRQRIAGTATSPDALPTAVIAHVVESLYEQIASHLAR